MPDWASLFSSEFMPHGHCYLWRPDILWLNVGSDGLIALAYYSIPLALTSLVRRRRDLSFGWLFWMFAAFIFLCGTTHLVSIWTVWNGAYGIEGMVKLATAGVSVATAALLWPVLPRALALPSPSQLAEANAGLRREIEERRRVEEELLRVQGELERRVRERTAALEDANRELKRSLQELDEFAHVVSHDLKAPLRGIVSLASWISEDCAGRLPPRAQEQLAMITERTGRMGDLIDGILRYSRLGREKAAVEAVDAGELVRDVIASLAAPAGIRVHVEDGLPTVSFDRTQLRQVFQNLLSNAIQHLGRPSGEVRVSCREEPQAFEFSVRDDGVGIEERHFARIFRMVQSLDPDRQTTGIGLAIVKKIVETHGGAIRVESRPGAGATFRFTVLRTPAPTRVQGAPRLDPE